MVESIFSMEGDRAPLADLAALAERYGAELIVDEAHAIGVRGPRGSGCVAEAGLSARVLATVHTCGKALAAAGAFVCGSENSAPLSDQSRAHFYFQYGAAAIFCGAGCRRNESRRRSENCNGLTWWSSAPSFDANCGAMGFTSAELIRKSYPLCWVRTMQRFISPNI